MRYAEVSVNSPVARRKTFSYAIPPGATIEPGHAVWVPFGDKVLQGIVFELTDYPQVEETRDIIGTIGSSPLLSQAHTSLARWISHYYLSPLFDAVALMLPPGFERRTLTYVTPSGREHDPTTLTPHQQEVLRLADRRGSTGLRDLEKALGKRNAQAAVTQLVGRGLLDRSYELERARVGPKRVPYLRLIVPADEAGQEADRLMRRATKQAAMLRFLAGRTGPTPLSEAREQLGSDRAVAESLARKGLVAVEMVEVRRRPHTPQGAAPSPPLRLTPAQEAAFGAIRSSLTTETRSAAEVFLLHGVTGSGKTEVYLRALEETVKMGKRGIVLVPEISLTPQTIERFAARFPGRVAVLHSRLSPGEQYDEWHAIREGEFDVVIGPRSATFAPQPDLGLVVIDEEHEWTYKQQEQSPRYHAREAAIKLAEFSGAVVVLGSATPDIETFYRAERGEYHLLRLPERVTPGGASLPRVEVVDLREELKSGNRSVFSVSLAEAIERVLTNGEQAILFLNRRGGATSIVCRNCGFVLGCRRCEIPLSYHLTEDMLVCHQCNQRSPVPRTCPRCRSGRIKFLGLGTQKLEREASLAFPEARLLRWDSDVTRRKHSHQEIMDQFRNHEADILIGTQMVAKGLDLPRVTLVGVVNADTSLNLPDFRAGERTFQLLCQVAGRAGRGTVPGQVIVQTFSPEHYAVQTAAHHDYGRFYEREIGYRRQLRNPPFAQLACLTYTHANDAACRKEAERMEQTIITERDARGVADLSLIGPAPAFVHRLRGRFRWQLILRGTELSEFLAQVPIPQGWTVDVDPVGL